MKKMYKYILIITLMMFGFIGEVRAGSADVHICVEKGTCELKCTYENEDKTEKAYIYMINASVKSDNIIYGTSFSWDDEKSNIVYFLNSSDSAIDGNGVIDTVNRAGVKQYGGITAFIPEDLLKQENFSCPLNAYKDTDWYEEICFDNDGTYCKEKKDGFTKFNYENPKEEEIKIENRNYSAKKAKKEIQKILDKNSDNSEITEVCVFNNSVNPLSSSQFVMANFKGGNFKFYRHVYDGKHNFVELTSKDYKFDFPYNTLNQSCYSIGDVYYISAYWPDGVGSYMWEYTYSYKPNAQSQAWLKHSEEILNLSDKWSVEINGDEDEEEPDYNCESLIGTDLVNEINSYLLYIKIAVPILIIVLGSIDFLIAFIASDEDKMKKAQKRFIMRLIIGMVIFFVPSLVKVLLNIANEVWSISNDTCGITF